MWLILLLVAFARAQSTSPEYTSGVPVCGPNETYYKKEPCPPRTCDSNYTIYICDGKPRKGGCDCKDKYSRHPHGSCVLSGECPPKPACGPNETHYHHKPCPPRTCDMFVSNNTYLCEGDPREYGCDCLDGYYRNSQSLCVMSKDCRVPEGGDRGNGSLGGGRTCGVNEKYYKSIPCPPLNCNISFTSYNCDNVPHTSGCDCEEDYLRAPNQTCVFYEYCPPPNQCGANETYVECNGCQEYCPTLANSGYRPVCDQTTDDCLPGCACKPGYVRISIDDADCIPSDSCPNPCGGNKTYVECNACPEYCPTENSSPGCFPPENCPPGCACKPGYVRKSVDDDTCIPSESCPPVKCSKPNQVWNSCASNCTNESCDAVCKKDDEDEDGVFCPAVCVRKCVCRKGYCKTKRGQCVRSPKCHKKNEQN